MINILELNEALKNTKTESAAEANNTLLGIVGEIADINTCYACNNTCWATAWPHLTGCAGAVCAHDASVYFRDGGSCVWTVPAGATVAKFEVWGAGAGSGAGNCCGGSPQGENGAYGTIVIPVTEGDTYTLCGGAASNIRAYCSACCGDLSGKPSYVKGPGLDNFCAEGGCSNLCFRQGVMNALCSGGITYCKIRWQSPGAGTTACGLCICDPTYGTFTCSPGTMPSNGLIPIMPDCQIRFYGTAFGMPGIFSGGCWDTNYYGYDLSAPVVSPVDGTTACQCCTCWTWTSGTCCGYRGAACAGINCFPGMGGTPTHVMGGNVGLYGDWGRTGMAKVSWC